jgi:hypothetical protein
MKDCMPWVTLYTEDCLEIQWVNEYTRAIRKVTSCELLRKQAMRKNYNIQKLRIYLSYFST